MQQDVETWIEIKTHAENKKKIPFKSIYSGLWSMVPLRVGLNLLDRAHDPTITFLPIFCWFCGWIYPPFFQGECCGVDGPSDYTDQDMCCRDADCRTYPKKYTKVCRVKISFKHTIWSYIIRFFFQGCLNVATAAYAVIPIAGTIVTFALFEFVTSIALFCISPTEA